MAKPLPKLDPVAIGDRLRQARIAIGKSQKDFGAALGRGQNAISQYESGERPLTLTPAIALCEEFGLSLDWLYRGDSVFMQIGFMERLARRSDEKPDRR